MKIVLDYDRVKAFCKGKGVKKLSELCRRADVKYTTLLNQRYLGNGVSIEVAWKLSKFLDCSINEIVKPEEDEA